MYPPGRTRERLKTPNLTCSPASCKVRLPDSRKARIVPGARKPSGGGFFRARRLNVMRTRHWLVLVSLGFGVVGVVGAGCGGSSTQAGNDAGSDGTMMPDVTMMMDTAPPPPMDAGHDSPVIVDAPPEA